MEHHLLRLPGIGTFHYTANPNPNPNPNQQEQQLDISNDIRFDHSIIREPDESLIDYIKQKTGKIRPLALADLSSFIESGQQLINIGKPFFIEGIGTIQKTREGKHELVPYELAISNPRMEDYPKEATTMASLSMKHPEKKRSVFEDEKYQPGANPLQKLLVVVLILGGLAVVVFGGYFLYNQTGGDPNPKQNDQQQVSDTTLHQKDSIITPPDTTQATASYASLQPATYKFVLESSGKKRALARYNLLKSYGMDIKMETKDSTSYKLFFILPATPNDTTRIKDSLGRYYARKVLIEN
ncbi:MAG TPA: hypothetical protein VFZ47_08325 [Chitinophagaceae bacterium]